MAAALSHGKSQLSEEAQHRIEAFIRSQQLDDGSFMDKNGCPDVYYTAFGWLLCYVFGIPLPRATAGNYLSTLSTENLDLIHYAAYIRCRLMYRLLTQHRLTFLTTTLFPAFFKKDAIQSKRMPSLIYPHDDADAPYSLFVRLSLLEDAGKRIKNPKEWLQTLRAYQIQDGGYSNLKGNIIIVSINATAAALCILKQLKSDKADSVAHFLLQQQHASGGFSASPDAPLPDLLSTATTLFALNTNGLKPNLSARDFIEAHWNEHTGGFSATLFDETSDVEYVFYGLLALGSL